ncbi:MAG: chemoreceptor glutamine deamidase CheD [Thiotrichales bacterium]
MITVQAGFENIRKFWDPNFRLNVAKVLPGDYYVGTQDELITTVLGSCVAACIRDTQRKVGGMNHFLLPLGDMGGGGGWETTSVSASTRYGNFAMEHLINGILRSGGKKQNLEIKLFGGASVMDLASSDVGRRNIDFVLSFLREEGLPVHSQDLGGTLPRKLMYHPLTGKALVKKLVSETQSVVASEMSYLQKVRATPVAGEIELF